MLRESEPLQFASPHLTSAKTSHPLQLQPTTLIFQNVWTQVKFFRSRERLVFTLILNVTFWEFRQKVGNSRQQARNLRYAPKYLYNTRQECLCELAPLHYLTLWSHISSRSNLTLTHNKTNSIIIYK